MVNFPVTLKQSHPSVFTEIDRRLDRFLADERTARQKAAKIALFTSHAMAPSERPIAPARRGRAQTSRLRSNIAWTADATSSTVSLDYQKLNRTNPYWVIQEIGTGQRGTMKRAGVTNPVGRAAKGSQYVVAVRSQVGRPIPSGLVWATGPRGTFMRPGQGFNQNLYQRSKIKGAPRGRRFTMTITREIEGSHFIQGGARAGFRQYRPSVLAAARQAFDRSKRP
jgi:hypothetical protein